MRKRARPSSPRWQSSTPRPGRCLPAPARPPPHRRARLLAPAPPRSRRSRRSRPSACRQATGTRPRRGARHRSAPGQAAAHLGCGRAAQSAGNLLHHHAAHLLAQVHTQAPQETRRGRQPQLSKRRAMRASSRKRQASARTVHVPWPPDRYAATSNARAPLPAKRPCASVRNWLSRALPSGFSRSWISSKSRERPLLWNTVPGCRPQPLSRSSSSVSPSRGRSHCHQHRCCRQSACQASPSA